MITTIEGFDLKLIIVDDIWRSGLPILKLRTYLTDFNMRNDHIYNVIKANI